MSENSILERIPFPCRPGCLRASRRTNQPTVWPTLSPAQRNANQRQPIPPKKRKFTMEGRLAGRQASSRQRNGIDFDNDIEKETHIRTRLRLRQHRATAANRHSIDRQQSNAVGRSTTIAVISISSAFVTHLLS